jgi:hypothetical protein
MVVLWAALTVRTGRLEVLRPLGRISAHLAVGLGLRESSSLRLRRVVLVAE